MEDLHSIRRGLLEYLVDRTAMPQDADETTDLILSGVLDSLMLMDLVLHIQTAFGIQLQPADVTPEHFRSVASLGQLVHQRQNPAKTRAA